jgi:hypothetical protein
MTRRPLDAARRRRRYQGRLHDVDQLASARQSLAMTEDELLQGLTDALTYCGWRWMHVRRSDLAIVQGHQGFPDVVAARAGELLFLELKTEGGRATDDQVAWLRAVQLDGDNDGRIRAAIVRPSTYDATLELIR